MGARESLNGREKNGAKKSKEGGEKSVLASDWCKKTLCFSAQSEGSTPMIGLACPYTE